MASNDFYGESTRRGDSNGESTPRGETGRKRARRPDTATLSAGMLALAIATYLLGGFAASGMQWILAAGAVCVGAVILAASLSPDSKRNSA